ncbi:hypothetical protein Y5W_01359 [Alcanivorax sp. 521-1]|uniref:DUF2809 domain-containing protein n=1 Tax=Alloalcanivorax profundimaris TaxID=2735259 RepID=A0ABS0AS19_9GAMM|nr:hypothetical protein [Alloalcanivorax profundimaris]
MLAGGLRRHVRASGGPVLHLGALTGMTLSARLAFPLVSRLRFFTLLLVLAVVLEVAQSVLPVGFRLHAFPRWLTDSDWSLLYCS